MKKRLNLTIEATLLKQMKFYASQKGESVSEIVEHYFEKLVLFKKGKNIIDLVDHLERPAISEDMDLIEEYYHQGRRKHGF
ncbi:MAG: hypothetical protein EPN37_08675 [Chitinophagaceae bacterium]|nr:MAG: hypothetical protein EPN37_08675 [Chitinophagaceae bacterium]